MQVAQAHTLSSTFESNSIPSSSFYLPPLIRDNQVLFVTNRKNSRAPNENIINIFKVDCSEWERQEISALLSSSDLGFCLSYTSHIAVLCLTSMKSHLAAVEIYKLKEMCAWEKIPLVGGTLNPIDLQNCQCVQSTRNVVLASVYLCTLMLFVHRYSSRQPWIDVSYKLQDNTDFKLQSCAISRHTLYCSLLCTENNGQRKLRVYKLDLDSDIENRKAQDLELICVCSPNVIQCHLFMTNSGKAMTVHIVTHGSSRGSNTLEVRPLQPNAIGDKLFEKDWMSDTEILSVLPLQTDAFKNKVVIVYFDKCCSQNYLEVISLTQ